MVRGGSAWEDAAAFRVDEASAKLAPSCRRCVLPIALPTVVYNANANGRSEVLPISLCIPLCYTQTFIEL